MLNSKSRNNYNTSMKRLLLSGKIKEYPTYDDVIRYIGDKPDDTEYYTFTLEHTRSDTGVLLASDFHWCRQLLPAIIDTVHELYKDVTSRQQVKKALQKLSYKEISDVISFKRHLQFKIPYKKRESLYKDSLGTVIGSYKIIDLFYHRRDKIRTEYSYIVQCVKCNRLKITRCHRFLNNECSNCNCISRISVNKHKSSRKQLLYLGFITGYLFGNTLSEYSRFFSHDPESFYNLYLDSNQRDFTDIFGDYLA